VHPGWQEKAFLSRAGAPQRILRLHPVLGVPDREGRSTAEELRVRYGNERSMGGASRGLPAGGVEGERAQGWLLNEIESPLA